MSAIASDSDLETTPSAPRFDVDCAKASIEDLLRLAQMWLLRIPQHPYTRQLVQEVDNFVTQCLDLTTTIDDMTSSQATTRSEFIVDWFHRLQTPANKLCTEAADEADPIDDSADDKDDDDDDPQPTVRNKKPRV